MDIEAALKDLRAALALLPKDMVKTLLTTIFGNMFALASVYPQLRYLLEPHLKAGMLANQAGILDMSELQEGLQSIVADYLAD